MNSVWVASAGQEFGTVLGVRRAGDFLLRMSRYAPARRFPPHHHSLAYFCVVVRGEIRERCGGEERRYASRSVHYHPAGEPHVGEIGPAGLTSLSIIPGGSLAERLRPLAAHGAATAPLDALAARCLEAFRQHDDAADLLLEGAALELTATLLRGARSPAGSARAPWLAEVRDYLHAHRARRIALRELSARAGVHEVHLIRAFRRGYGVTPGAYLRRLRLEDARAALVDSDRPLAEIALAAGFSSQAHFTRAFGQAFGLPPGAWRRRYGRPRG